MKDNKLNKIQDILIRQLERLDSEKVMKEEGKEEIQRSGAITHTATTFVKTTDLELKILTAANNNALKVEDLEKYLGLK